MKVTRSYWLGLGSGLVLSAMLNLIMSPQQGQAVITQEPSPTAQPSVLTQPSQGSSLNTQSSTQVERQFVISAGANLEQIADLLVAQGFIKDKDSFLAGAHQMGVENQFRAGNFILSLGLTTEELIKRLLK